MSKKVGRTGQRKMSLAMKQRSNRTYRLIALTGLVMGFTCLLWVISMLYADKPVSAAEPVKAPALPPLVVDQETPLLLSDSASETNEQLQKQLTLNAACFVCHGNYEREELVTVHAAEEVGCVDCHGDSFEHRNDENNVTPPDIMYPAEKIDAACQDCHDTHDVAATEVLARWQQRCPQKQDVSQIVCTDCHGEHRLAQRTVRWDKRTRELIPVADVPE
jgi:hypothetical protein